MGDGFNPYIGRVYFFVKRKTQKSQNPVTQVQVSEPKTEAPMNLHQLRKAAENNDLHLGRFGWLDWIGFLGRRGMRPVKRSQPKKKGYVKRIKRTGWWQLK